MPEYPQMRDDMEKRRRELWKSATNMSYSMTEAATKIVPESWTPDWRALWIPEFGAYNPPVSVNLP